MAHSLATKSLKDDSSVALRERQAPKPVVQAGSGNQILALQQSVGNRAVGDLLQSGGDMARLVSANLNISHPEDPSEREARQTASRLGSSGDAHETPLNVAHSTVTDSQPLPESTRAHFEPRLGVDLSNVRLNTGARAASSARALGAKAFTLGSDIVFGEGQYAPATKTGQQLLAHELSHVAQQNQAGVSANTIHRDDEPPRPKIASSVTQKFADLPENTSVSDPKGATHGIRVIRRGDELFYRLPPPNNQERQVPRPLDVKTNKRQAITAISWGGGGIGQTAFDVEFDNFDSPYSVNIFGVGRMQTLIDALFRKPAALETEPEGLERERTPGILPQARPKGAAFKTAQRYHMPGATFSMYVFTSRTVQVFDDTTGARLWAGVDGKDLRDLQISPNGDVLVSWADPAMAGGIFSVKFNLRGPQFSPTGLGQLAASADRTTLLGELKALDVKVVERGSQFNDLELQAAVDVLKRWQGKKGVVESLKANGVPGLTLMKDVLMDTGGSYEDVTGVVKIPGGVRTTPAEERNVVIHEVSHALFQAKGFYSSTKGKSPPKHVQEEAADLLEDSDLDLIDEGVVGRSRLTKKRTQKDWEKALSSDEKLNKIWHALHKRFPIPDPEGTSDIRGLDVADESRYIGGNRGDVLGHGFDNVNEFVASFVASSLRFQDKMTETVKNSKDASLLSLYRQLWTIVNSNLINLGTKNPYD